MKVLLVDDNALFLDGLANMLTANDIEVAGTAGSGPEAITAAERLRPDVVLMDIQMPGGGGIEATRALKARLPDVKVVMLTVSQDNTHLFEAIKAGAAGYLLKGMAKEQFLSQLAAMAAGETPLSPGLAAKIMAEFARRENRRDAKEEANTRTAHLTPRQEEILGLVAGGLIYKEIGGRLGISEAAVKYHMGEITARLQVENKAQAVAFAANLGLAATKEE